MEANAIAKQIIKNNKDSSIDRFIHVRRSSVQPEVEQIKLDDQIDQPEIKSKEMEPQIPALLPLNTKIAKAEKMK